jgi:FkbM family methyltransferase
MLKRLLTALRGRRADPAASLADRAAMHLAADEPQPAIELLRLHLQREPDDDDAALALARALESTGERLEAARVCLRAFAPGRPVTGLYVHAFTLFDTLRADDALGDADDPADLLARANTLLDRADHAPAKDLLERSLARLPAWPPAHQRLGCIAALAGDLEAAATHFATSAAFGYVPDAYIELGAGALDACDPGVQPLSVPARPADARAVVLIACDPVYFRRHLPAAFESLRRNAGLPIVLHLHVYNPDPWIDEEIAALPRTDWITAVESSVEHFAFDSREAAKTRYSCGRLPLAATLLERYGRPLLMQDADALTLRSIAPLLDAAADADVSLLRWSASQWRIWDLVYASSVLFMPTPGGLRFARMAGRYVERHIERPSGAWYLDQIALFAASARLLPCDVRCAPMAPQTYSLFAQDRDTPPPEAVFWSVTANIASHASALDGLVVQSYLPRTRRAFGWTLPGNDRFFTDTLSRAPESEGRRRWDAELMAFCLERIARRRRAIDAGAHVGFWSDVLARHFDRVDAFEPVALLRECFTANLRHAHVELHPCALGAAPGSACVTVEPGNSGMSHLTTGAAGEIEVRTLDAFGFMDVDFVKIDAEGFEAAILRGAQDTLLRCRPVVLVEQNEAHLARYGEPPRACASLLESWGARLVAEFDDTNLLYIWPD